MATSGASIDAAGISEATRWVDGIVSGLGFVPGSSNSSNALAVDANSSEIVGVYGGADE
jgi:hypothetical protein